MEEKINLMFEPLPRGWIYGFPRPLPEEAVIVKGDNLSLDPKFNIVKWVASFGFPEDEIYKYKIYKRSERSET
tara:strand:- start:9 stop:227 length:219 start_codon:yes stop_codon:yes gene_type:complete